MDNQYYKSVCSDIDCMSEKELKDFISRLKVKINRKMPSTNMAVDLANHIWHKKATNRLVKF